MVPGPIVVQIPACRDQPAFDEVKVYPKVQVQLSVHLFVRSPALRNFDRSFSLRDPALALNHRQFTYVINRYIQPFQCHLRFHGILSFRARSVPSLHDTRDGSMFRGSDGEFSKKQANQYNKK